MKPRTETQSSNSSSTTLIQKLVYEKEGRARFPSPPRKACSVRHAPWSHQTQTHNSAPVLKKRGNKTNKPNTNDTKASFGFKMKMMVKVQQIKTVATKDAVVIGVVQQQHWRQYLSPFLGSVFLPPGSPLRRRYTWEQARRASQWQKSISGIYSQQKKCIHTSD